MIPRSKELKKIRIQFYKFCKFFPSNQCATISSSEKIILRHSIELFYAQNTSENEKYQTYQQFKDHKSYRRPIYTK